MTTTPPQKPQTILFFVGPDMCGKTEISTALSKKLNIPRYKASSEHNTFRKQPGNFVKQLRYADPRLLDFIKQTRTNVIFDRGFPCEKVYSTILDRATDDEQIELLDKAWGEIGAKIIVCFRSNYDHIIDDIDKSLSGDKLQKIELEYRRFADTSNCKSLFLNVDSEDLNSQVDQIIDWLYDV